MLGAAVLIGLLLLTGCITRTEVENYTITMVDTTVRIFSKTPPDRKDWGIVAPSSRQIRIERKVVQWDSVVERYYPDFIRLGVFESAGLVGTAPEGTEPLYPGLFGLFSLTDRDTSGVFSGGLYRFGIGEWRLRWFRDAPNWTIGTYAMEMLIPYRSSSGREILYSVLPLYLRKRFFLRETIPYVALTPTVGISAIPSAYIHLGGTFDVGSIGGLNLRVYLGYWYGMTAGGDIALTSQRSVTFSTFAAGIGISFLDFLNRVEETEMEWKDHPHSAWNVGVAHFGLFYREPDTAGNPRLPGVSFTLFPSYLALPIDKEHFRFLIGLSAFRSVVLDDTTFAYSFVPLRFGYWYTLIPDELSISPFLEYGFYPYGLLDLGVSLNLYVNPYVSLRLVGGYMQSSAVSEWVADRSIHRWYGAIVVGLGDRIFFDHQLRYAK